MGLVLTVIMFVISGRFRYMEVTEMVWQALECVLLQAMLVFAATLLINITAALRFDRKGEHRRKNRNAK